MNYKQIKLMMTELLMFLKLKIKNKIIEIGKVVFKKIVLVINLTRLQIKFWNYDK